MLKKYRYALTAFLVNFICAAVSIGVFMAGHHGLFSLRADFNEQMIPFAMNANDLIKGGNLSWASCMDLGTDFVGAYSYYDLGSPFFWISLIFPARYFMYAAGWLYMLKYAVAGLTSYLYFERYVKDRRYALMGSLLYAFSGFQSVNLLMYMFHDVVAFFPLLLLGLDDLVQYGRKGRFAFAVFINALLNYFFFVGEAVFLVIYFCCRYLKKDIRITCKNIMHCAGEGVLGVGMSAVLFIPSILFTLGNPRASSKLSFPECLHYDLIRYLTILRAFIFPGEMMSDQSTLSAIDWTSTSAYLPMVGIILVIAFIMKNRKHWLTRLLITSFIFCMIPVLNESFTLFTSDYSRWFYMPVLFMSLASAMVCDEKEKYGAGIPAIIVSVLLILFIAGGFCIDNASLSWKVVLHPYKFAVQCIGAFAGIGLTYVLFRFGGKKYAAAMITGVLIFSAASTIWMISWYREGQESPETLYKRMEAADNINTDYEGYRFTNKMNSLTIAAGLPGSGTFSTTVGGSIFEFYRSLGLERVNNSPEGPEGTEELLSERYTIVQADDGSLSVSEDDTIEPIGKTYGSYITASEFEKIPEEQRVETMLKTLVVKDEDESVVKDILVHSVSCCDPPQYSKEYEDSGFRVRSVIDANKDGMAFFSIPYDRGWKVSVNGKPADILDINGMMAVEIGKGKNTICFIHHTFGITAGITVSVMSFILFFVLMIRSHESGKNRTSDQS